MGCFKTCRPFQVCFRTYNDVPRHVFNSSWCVWKHARPKLNGSKVCLKFGGFEFWKSSQDLSWLFNCCSKNLSKVSKFWENYFHLGFKVMGFTHFRPANIQRQFSHIGFQILSYLRHIILYFKLKTYTQNVKCKICVNMCAWICMFLGPTHNKPKKLTQNILS